MKHEEMSEKRPKILNKFYSFGDREMFILLGISLVFIVSGFVLFAFFRDKNIDYQVPTRNIQELVSEHTADDTDAAFDVLPLTGVGNAEVSRSIILSKPTVVYIFNRSCAEVNVRKHDDFPSISGNKYEVCSGSFGTGFIVNSEGYFATNAHVAAGHPLDVVVNSLLYGYDPDGLYDGLVSDAPGYLGLDLDVDTFSDEEEYLQELEDMIVEAVVSAKLDEVIDVKEVSTENYLLKNKTFKFNEYDITLKDPSDYIETSIVTHEKINSLFELSYRSYLGEKVGITVPDLALLKIEDSQDEYPAVELANPDTMTSGQTISVIGFPGIAANEFLFSEKSTKIPTVTRGTISAIKENSTGKFELVQIDASISYGNSGGPVVNEDAQVVAIATYGISFEQSGDYNAGVSVEELRDIMEEEGIENETGTITSRLDEGLDYLESDYYKWAIEYFEGIISDNPNLEGDLDPLIAIAQEKIDKGEDNTPVFSIAGYNIHQNELLLLCGSLCLIILGIIFGFILLIAFAIRRRRRKRQQPPQGITQPVTPAAQYPQPVQQVPQNQYPTV